MPESNGRLIFARPSSENPVDYRTQSSGRLQELIGELAGARVSAAEERANLARDIARGSSRRLLASLGAPLIQAVTGSETGGGQLVQERSNRMAQAIQQALAAQSQADIAGEVAPLEGQIQGERVALQDEARAQELAEAARTRNEEQIMQAMNTVNQAYQNVDTQRARRNLVETEFGLRGDLEEERFTRGMQQLAEEHANDLELLREEYRLRGELGNPFGKAGSEALGDLASQFEKGFGFLEAFNNSFTVDGDQVYAKTPEGERGEPVEQSWTNYITFGQFGRGEDDTFQRWLQTVQGRSPNSLSAVAADLREAVGAAENAGLNAFLPQQIDAARRAASMIDQLSQGEDVSADDFKSVIQQFQEIRDVPRPNATTAIESVRGQLTTGPEDRGGGAAATRPSAGAQALNEDQKAVEQRFRNTYAAFKEGNASVRDLERNLKQVINAGVITEEQAQPLRSFIERNR